MAAPGLPGPSGPRRRCPRAAPRPGGRIEWRPREGPSPGRRRLPPPRKYGLPGPHYLVSRGEVGSSSELGAETLQRQQEFRAGPASPAGALRAPLAPLVSRRGSAGGRARRPFCRPTVRGAGVKSGPGTVERPRGCCVRAGDTAFTLSKYFCYSRWGCRTKGSSLLHALRKHLRWCSSVHPFD